MKLSRQALMLSLLAASTAFATPAAAAFVVDTGVPAQTGGILVSNQFLAGLFTLGATTTVKSVEGFIGGFGGNGNISIYTGGVDPGFSGLLHSANFAVAASGTGDWQGVFGQNWNLAAGQYWVVFTTDGFNSMRQGAPNPLSQYATSSLVTGPWAQQGSRLGLGVRIGDNVGVGVGAVPEPATWAMMLIGFGAIGGAMRARRRVSVSYG